MIDTNYKILSFVDCGGQQKYHRSSFQYLLSYTPDYTMVCISALMKNEGIKNQLEVAIALQCSFAIIITHIDLVDKSQINKTIKAVV